MTDLVALAGAAILAVDRTRMRVDGKADGSPVTEADLAADRIIAEGLARLASDIPALSEERANQWHASLSRQVFFLIDPLDGTKEFVAGRNEFTVNLALVVKGTPLLGIIGAPALGLIWRGLVGHGAERLATGQGNGIGPALPIRTRRFPPPAQPWIAAVSRSHGDASHRSLHRRAPRRCQANARLGRQICEGRGGRGRYLSAPGADLANGTLPPGMRSSPLPAAKSPIASGGELRFGERLGDFIVPGFIAWGDPRRAKAAPGLLRQLIFERGPAQCRLPLHKARDRRQRHRRVSSRPNR